MFRGSQSALTAVAARSPPLTLTERILSLGWRSLDTYCYPAIKHTDLIDAMNRFRLASEEVRRTHTHTHTQYIDRISLFSLFSQDVLVIFQISARSTVVITATYLHYRNDDQLKGAKVGPPALSGTCSPCVCVCVCYRTLLCTCMMPSIVSIPYHKLSAKPPTLGPLASVLVANESLNCATTAQQVALLPMLRSLREFLLAESQRSNTAVDSPLN